MNSKRTKIMNKEYKIKIEESQKMYSKIFWDVYKKNKIFRKRRGIYLIVSIITFLLLIGMCYLDFGNVIFSTPFFWLYLFIIFMSIGYILPICINRNDLKIVYKCYWKLREDLYEKGINIEEVTFFSDKIHILECKGKKINSKFISYKDINQIIFEKSGIALRETTNKGFIFISNSQIGSKKGKEQIKRWYKECKRHDSNRL